VTGDDVADLPAGSVTPDRSGARLVGCRRFGADEVEQVSQQSLVHGWAVNGPAGQRLEQSWFVVLDVMR
jgi:hypothetical protein